jgi:cobalt/nickel transport protein
MTGEFVVMPRRLWFGLLAILLAASPAAAHYHLLLPDKPAAKTGEMVTFTFQFGHPFEHQLFDTQPPEAVYVIAPDGTKIDLAAKLEKLSVDGTDGKKVTGYRFAFTPEKRGDHVVVAISPAVKVEGELLPLKDAAKVVLHVQTQNGWEHRGVAPGAAPLETSPLTRPYGLRAGMAFQVEVEEPAEGGGRPLAGVLVEIERYNPTPPKELPPDEHITRTARTTRAGSATATLTEPGWWGLTAIRDKVSARHRSTLWVHVDEKVPTAADK